MKVLHVSYSDIIGGANKAIFSIHESLKGIKIDSKMLVLEKHSSDNDVIGIRSISSRHFFKNKIKQIIANKIKRYQKTENATIHSLNIFKSGLHKIINSMNIDIVNLNWINNEMISIAEISKIDKPLFWTLADMWPYSGSEHYAIESKPIRFIEGYKKSNRHINHKGIDLDRIIWNKKKHYLMKKKIHFIATSKWNADCLRKSKLFCNHEVDIAPQCINLDIFKPTEKKSSRRIFNLPNDKFLILFAANNPKQDIRKGFFTLKKSLKFISKNLLDTKIELVMLGSDDVNLKQELGINCHYINYLHDDYSRSILYNACDLLLSPSIQENLSNIVMESMASGLPAVAYNIGGMPDLIDHDKNGYLVKPFNFGDFAGYIESLSLSKKTISNFSKNARLKAVKNYSSKVIALKYKNIFKKGLLS